MQQHSDATFQHHRYGEELAAAARHSTQLAAAEGAAQPSNVYITHAQFVSIADRDVRRAIWRLLNDDTRRSIAAELLIAKHKPRTDADISALVADLDASAGVAPSEASVAAPVAPTDHTTTVTASDLTEPPHIDTITHTQLCFLLAQQYGVRAVDTMQGNLSNPETRVRFTGGVLAVTSASEKGRIHITDGAACPCRGGKHATCWHRTLWHYYTLYTALVDPTDLFHPALVAAGAA